MTFADQVAALDAACFDAFGVVADWQPPEGVAVQVRVVMDERTHVVGQLGDTIDPRPSVRMRRSEVGDDPRGTLTINGTAYVIGAPVDEDGDRTVVRHWLQRGAL